MKAVLSIIALLLLAAAVAGAFVFRGGAYIMFLLALAMVTFFGALPVVLGALTRRVEARVGDGAARAERRGDLVAAAEVIAWPVGAPGAEGDGGGARPDQASADAAPRTGPAAAP